MFKKIHLRTLTFVILDIFSVSLSFLLSALILNESINKNLILYGIITLAVVLISFFAIRLYDIVYATAGLFEGLRVLLGCVTITVITFIASVLFLDIGWRFPVIFNIFFAFASACLRFAKRLYITYKKKLKDRKKERTRVMIIGAGSAGALMIRELQSSKHLTMTPVCALDDDPMKHNKLVCNVPVVGTTSDIVEAAQKYKIDEIIVAMPVVPAKELKPVYERCALTKCKVKTLPGVYQLINDEVNVSKLRQVEIADLLGREQIKIDVDHIAGYIKDKVVLVTGGGGSIGSELCRQLAAQAPKLLIIFDIYENNAYDIEQELRRTHPELNLLALIGSVRDKKKVDHLFETYRPEIVFNAAAHKHVPLMETSPNEAVKNNVFGTLNVAAAADKYSVRRFVQISTDKAVNPTNIMGATKRICEMIIQSYSRHSKTEFVAVRFGNVLGSNGSVIPLFKKQIESGGPVTVTHKDIIRYFMTIQEAVSLVLQAGAYAKGGEIFVLDMGEPVRIYDLAVNLIRLSGLKPGVDIDIECTGLRPGEKLYEERLMAEEGLQKTANDLISIGKPLDIDEEFLNKKLDELYSAAYSETDRMKELIAELVPTYKIDTSLNN
ncbi:MAG: polysaccharide biosynthesis protein [Ruminococcaceae bacterium]|nr:polysaccharide biosynthesis protein [Oscillospiraceae bacterium]